MCGIIGYVGERDACSILLDGLKKLEYRGYDSAGLAVVNNYGLNVVKKKGKISLLKEDFNLSELNGNLGIGHTRWATHGEPNEVNSHPHVDCNNQLAIVHNGIIENYVALKKLLKSEGHRFISETDSEVLAHLIEKFYEGNLEVAVMKTLNLVEGAFGIAVIHKDEKKIVAARRGSPLILGVGNNEMFVASDIPAVLNYTNKIIYLKDNEVATLTKDSYCIKNFDGEEVKKNVHEIMWTVDQIEKNNFKHFMLKEIFEQPDSIRNVLRGRIKEGRIKLSLDVDFRDFDRIKIVACGTSWHSALIGKYIIEKIARFPVEVDYASEFRYRDPLISERDLVIAISQSGETADTLAAIKEVKKKGGKVLGIVNVVGSSITREVDSGIYLHAGPEIGVASTKAFTSQILALILLALYIKQEKGEEVDISFLNELVNLPEKVEDVLKNAPQIKRIAENFKYSRDFLYLGRGINFPVALEGALKLKEISYIHAEGYPAAEMKHGPIALIDKDMPVVFLATKDSLYEKTLSNIQEVKARGGKVISVVNDLSKDFEMFSDYFIEVPSVCEELSCVVNVVALQLIAYYIADAKGLDVDKPRNLAKSVTVE
jgi:glucosamine--fructose-6-phosphate aminotransferase (isomerizing)